MPQCGLKVEIIISSYRCRSVEEEIRFLKNYVNFDAVSQVWVSLFLWFRKGVLGKTTPFLKLPVSKLIAFKVDEFKSWSWVLGEIDLWKMHSIAINYQIDDENIKPNNE